MTLALLKLRSNSAVSFILIIIILIPIVSAIWAIDFGEHGDETLWIKPISESTKQFTFLPARYNYPSILYDLGIATLIPYGAFNILRELDQYKTISDTSDIFAQIIQDVSGKAWDQEYRLVLRTVFIILSSLSFIWIFLLVRTLQQNQGEALLSVALLAGSWELNYHLRFIAPDALLMQFGVFTMMLLVFSEKADNHARKQRYRRIAAIGAGLAFSTKYQGALFLIPVILSALLETWNTNLKKWDWRELIKLVLIFLIVFVISTPGSILQFPLLVRDIMAEFRHYAIEGHGAHTVTPGLEHLQLMVEYLGREALSNYPAISIFCALISILGVYSMWRSNKRFSLILLSVPVIYLLYVSRQRVMFIRNLLLLFPFLAIFAARGIFVVLNSRFLQHSFVRVPIFLLIGFVWAINNIWLLEAANSIVNPPKTSEMELLAQYIDQRPDTEFYLSDSVFRDLAVFDTRVRSNIVREPNDTAEYVFYGSDLFNILTPMNSRPLINRSDFYFYPLPNGRGNSNYYDVPPTSIVILDNKKLALMGIDTATML